MISQKINLPSLGEVVKAWRVFQRMSSTELGARTGLPKAYISQVEHGKVRQPGDENLARIASALGIPVEYLIVRRLPDTETQTKGSGFSFGAPDISERYSEGRIDILKEILREIAEINRRTEEIRRVVEELLKSEERVR